MVSSHPGTDRAYYQLMTFSVDTVDLASRTAAADFERAIRATGFVQLVGHDLDSVRRQSCYDAIGSFFELDPEVKSCLLYTSDAADE